MTRLYRLLLLALFGLITACSYNELPENLTPLPINKDGLVLNVETRAETYDGKALDEEYFVTAQDLANFVKYRRSASKRSDLAVKEVKSYGFDSSQTLFYILNYDKGWEVVAADKRVQPTLAHGDSGEFTMECDNEAMKFWMNMLADGILQTRLGNFEKEGEEITASAESKEPTDDPQSDHTAFWNAISPAQEDATRNPIINIPTPGPLDTLIIFPPTLPTEVRRYYIPNARVTRSEAVTVGTIAPTVWGQYGFCNSYCPTIAGESGRAPAGCVAIAGAQLLYSLYYHNGWSMITPLNAVCTGNTSQSDPGQSFSHYSTLPWGYMAIVDNASESDFRRLKTAVLIAYIGKISGMKYDKEGSGTSIDSLKFGLENNYSITCSNTSFNNSLAILSLNRTPIIIAGSNKWLWYDGHAWLIDQYIKTTTYIDKYYIDTTQELSAIDLAQLTIEDATGYTTDTAISKQFHMNWGWNGQDNGYYGLSPDKWETSDGDTYQYSLNMLYGFEQVE